MSWPGRSGFQPAGVTGNVTRMSDRSVLPERVHAAIRYLQETIKLIQQYPPSDMRTRAIAELAKRLEVLNNLGNTARQELIVEIHDRDGPSYRILAEQVGVSPATVENALKRRKGDGGGKHAGRDADAEDVTELRPAASAVPDPEEFGLRFAAAPVPEDM
jgi:hypothetical protein